MLSVVPLKCTVTLFNLCLCYKYYQKTFINFSVSPRSCYSPELHRSCYPPPRHYQEMTKIPFITGEVLAVSLPVKPGSC